MKNWIVNNFWIKIVSLILAVITWFYVNAEVNRQKYISGKFYKSTLIDRTKISPSLEKKQMNKGYVVENE